jgi:hypothetical protein
MRIYVASSWKNERQPEVVRVLREAGHDAYDFRDGAFRWRDVATTDQLTDPVRFRDETLALTVARRHFFTDMGALQAADATVLVLPCGRSAHLELGWAVGAGKRTIILLDDPLSEPELMYLAVNKLCTTMAEVIVALAPCTSIST